jgi:hypothetical protein
LTRLIANSPTFAVLFVDLVFGQDAVDWQVLSLTQLIASSGSIAVSFTDLVFGQEEAQEGVP